MLRHLSWCRGVASFKAAVGPRTRLLQAGKAGRLLDHGLPCPHRFPAPGMSPILPACQGHHGSMQSSAFSKVACERHEDFGIKTQSHLTSRLRRASIRQPSASGLPSINATHLHTSGHLKSRGTDWVRSLKEAPTPALTLGLSGLIPFVVPAIYTAATFTISPGLLWAQVAYGASILSFLGGVRWGHALTSAQGPTWAALGYSVLPSLVAWLGLLMPLQASQLCLVAGLFVAWAADASHKAYPVWFRSLRLLLSLVALMSLGVSYGFCLVYEPTSQSHGSNVMKLIKIVQIILED